MLETRRRILCLTMLVALPALGAGCGGESSPAPAPAPSASPLSLADRAQAVLASGPRFAATAGGFAIERAPEDHASLALRLPLRGEDALHFERPGLAIDVREPGASGPAKANDHNLQFAREGGTSYWTGTMSGYEEWLMIEHASMAAPVAEWEVSGATMTETAGVVSISGADPQRQMMVSATKAYRADGSPISPKLTVAGDRIQLWVDGEGEKVFVDPSWTTNGTMAHVRDSFPALLMTSGSWVGGIVVSGGNSGGGVAMTSVEVWSPFTNSWTASGIAQLKTARDGHTMTFYGNNGASGILVAGGINGSTAINTLETIDLNLGTSTLVGGTLATGRVFHTANLEPSGAAVVLIGGLNEANSTGIASADIFLAGSVNPTTNAMATGRFGHATAPVVHGANPSLIVTGGQSDLSTYLLSCEFFDFQTGRFTTAPAMNVARSHHSVTALADGRVLVAGGETTGSTAVGSAEVYNPTTNTWTATNNMMVTRFSHSAILLRNGMVLVAGGQNAGGAINDAELYDPAKNSWFAATNLVTARAYFGLSATAAGGALAIGGLQGTTLLGGSELYTLTTQGTACTANAQCATGFCSRDGICCDTQCDSQCGACAAANGATANGTCTVTVHCSAEDTCHDVGTCDANTGVCSNPNKTNGTSCDLDSNACTSDTCESGVCTAGSTIQCNTSNPCKDAGVCDPSSGTCPAAVDKADGTACDDGNACTTGETCTGGTCTGTAVVCHAMDVCHEVGTCDPASGCSNPKKANGTPCMGSGTCEDGTCSVANGSGGSTSSSTTGGHQGGGNQGGSAPTTTGAEMTTGSAGGEGGAGGGSGGKSAESSGGCNFGGDTNSEGWLALGLGVLVATRRRRRSV